MDNRIANFTFGVELELHIPRGSLNEICRQISEVTGQPCRYEGYTHTVREGWKVVTDSSVSGAGSTGFEFVSPILKGQRGLDELQKVLEVLNANGANVDGTDCGTHVHIGVGRNPEVNFLKRLIKSYLVFEPAIDGIMPRSRRGNNAYYCRSITTASLDRIDRAESWRDLVQLFPDKFFKLNLKTIYSYGTVEFRHHSGTIDFEKLSNWVCFIMRLTASAQDGSIALPASGGAAQVNRARRGSKSWLLGNMMMRPEGCSPQEAMSALNWPTVSLGHQAAICGLQVVRRRDGRNVRFYAMAVSASTQIEAGPATLERLLTMVRASVTEVAYFTNRAAHFAARQTTV